MNGSTVQNVPESPVEHKLAHNSLSENKEEKQSFMNGVNYNLSLENMMKRTTTSPIPTKEEDQQISITHLFSKLIGELMNSSERKLLYLSSFFVLCCSIIKLILFLFIGFIIDLLANTYNASILDSLCNNCNNTELIHIYIIILIVLCILSSLFSFIQSLITLLWSRSFIKRINCSVFNTVINLNLKYFDYYKNEIKDLRYLLTNDMKHIAYSINKTVEMKQLCANCIFGVICLFIINWDAALIIFGSFIIQLILTIIYIYRMINIRIKRKNAFNVVSMNVICMITHIETTKIFSKEKDELYIFEQSIDRAQDSHIRKHFILDLYKFCFKIFVYFTILSLIWYSTRLILDDTINYNSNHITLGTLITDLCILIQINVSMYQIVLLTSSVILKGFESFNRIFNILNLRKKETDPQTKSKYISSINNPFKGHVEIKNVSFAFPNPNESDKFILKNISLKFLPSKRTALVGVAGSGKSSIFKLLLKLYDPQQGEILIDDININEYNLSFLHSQIGYVGQTLHLFSNRSIGDNIKFCMKLDRKHHNMFDSKYFDQERLYFWREFRGINENDVINAAKAANAHGFIMNLRDQYNTIIGGKNGIHLTYGEKKRIAIARAILLNPKILLLDEAMTGLDPISEYLIKETLDKIMLNRSVIVIAHRLKTVINADMIYVVNKGKIVEYGTHDKLIKIDDGHYAELIKKKVFA